MPMNIDQAIDQAFEEYIRYYPSIYGVVPRRAMEVMVLQLLTKDLNLSVPQMTRRWDEIEKYLFSDACKYYYHVGKNGGFIRHYLPDALTYKRMVEANASEEDLERIRAQEIEALKASRNIFLSMYETA